MKDYDFCGWATKNDLRCADGRIIRRNAFRVNDGRKVPLVWGHNHGSPHDVLGHAVLENRDEGVYAYGYFNSTKAAKDAKESVEHGDIDSLSIWANNLEQVGNEVLHGVIREVSLVLAGANPGASIESVFSHSALEEDEDEGIIYSGDKLELAHSIDDEAPDPEDDGDDEPEEEGTMPTVEEIYDEMTEEQKMAVAAIVDGILNDEDDDYGEEDYYDDDEEDDDMRHNLFDGDVEERNDFLSHDDMENIISSAKKNGSLRESFYEYLGDDAELLHAIDTTGMTVATGTQTYGFNDPSMLFPDYKSLNTPPDWISRNMTWVNKVMSGVHKSPFSRIKSVYANITEDDARARGYIKGKQKKEEVFTTLKRTTDPQTVYKKQKMDRDDVIDITDFDVIAWIKSEMRVMLDEELARAILIGDGRASDSDDKIQESHIRPIATDVPLFNTQVKVAAAADATNDTIYSDVIDSIIRARKDYKGSGKPMFFTTEDVLTEMLLLKDKVGHRLYKTEAELATTLRVEEIITVEPMEGKTLTIKTGESTTKAMPLLGIIVNLKDYNVGADKGGQVSMFDDFDIDYNQMKYLIETRCSGALIKPFSALTILLDQAASKG